MYRTIKKIATFTFGLFVIVSCHDLEDLNVNPNGIDPNKTDPNLLLPTVISGISKNYVQLGFGDIAGVVQHTQKDGWSGSHNDYDWNVNSDSWAGYYDLGRTNDAMYQLSLESGSKFHEGAALVLRAFNFGLITDLWGDAPLSEAFRADESNEFFNPVFDSQASIYTSILADLESANKIFAGNPSIGEDTQQDLLFGGNAAKWRKFANSLALRYYMRLSVKDPGMAQAGISKISGNSGTYPLITSAEDDAEVFFPGNTPSDSWPTNTVFDEDPSGAYMRIKMCATLVESLQALNDPRIGVWANKVAIPLELDPNAPDDTDVIVEGKRVVSQNIVDAYIAAWGNEPNFDEEYVGIPPSTPGAPQYNLTPDLAQGVFNPHVSQLNDRYKQTSGDLLSARLISAAEVHFILAEAALYGWVSGGPENHYSAGIRESMNAWGVGDAHAAYMGGAPYDGLESILQQKWIASWSAATEAWFDYRRTGLPDFQTGESARRQALPLRFYYHSNDEIFLNTANAEAAIDKLEPTSFIGSDASNNSAWSKMWLLQGTDKPY